MLVNSDNEPISVVLKYLKFKDNNSAARNSLRSYCHHLKLFFEYLRQEQLDYGQVGIDEMAAFVRWLQNPYCNNKIISLEPFISPRKPVTINTIISTVLNFYDYLMRHQDYNINLSERLKKNISGSRRGFKDFLYHINKDKFYKAKILKIKTLKSKPKTITKEQVKNVIDNCVNIRDKFLIQLLWESSIRIGEALALWLEDFEVDACRIHIRDRGELSNHAEIKTICSPRSLDVSPNLINLFFDYISMCHTDEVDTNHVLIKLSGKYKYEPLEYQDVASLFRRLKLKTGLDITPHTLRHSSLTELFRAGWKPEHIQKRAGHAYYQSVVKMYIHPSDEDLRREWEKVENIMTFDGFQKGYYND